MLLPLAAAGAFDDAATVYEQRALRSANSQPDGGEAIAHDGDFSFLFRLVSRFQATASLSRF